MDTINILHTNLVLTSVILSLLPHVSCFPHRVLNKKLLSKVLLYLGPDSSVKSVCKYWKVVMKEAS